MFSGTIYSDTSPNLQPGVQVYGRQFFPATQFLLIEHISFGSQGSPLQGDETCPSILAYDVSDGVRKLSKDMHDTLGSSGESMAHIDSAECFTDILVQSTHCVRISKQTFRHI